MADQTSRPSLKSRRVLMVDDDRAQGTSRIGPGVSIKFSPAGEAVLEQVLKATSPDSHAVRDPFQDIYVQVGGEANAIYPPYSFPALQRLPDESPMLRQCIEAMVTNVEGHGYRLEYVGPEGQEETPAAKSEKRRINDLLDNLNPDISFHELRVRWRKDLETLGNAAMECGRDANNEVVMVNHVPFYTLRMTYKDVRPVDVEVLIPGDPTDPQSKPRRVVQKKYFRRFVQRVGAKVVYFKEFGDPRTIDPNTGLENDQLAAEDSATEILHTAIYSPATPYGVPRWINEMPSILGSRQAELCNLDFFRENAIPAMAVLVSGGKLTQTSVDEIENHISAARGRKSMNRVMVLEAVGDDAAGSDDGTIPPPKVDLKPLAGERQKEGFFLEYGVDCDKKVRSAFRMPPIFVGNSDDYSHATAKASYEVAESQVFGPERKVTDDVFNTKILRSLGIRFYELRSNPPRISDTEDVISALEAFEAMGALTPNTAIQMANEYFDLELPKIEEAWGDLPFELTKLIIQQEVDRIKGLDKFLNPAPEPDPALVAAAGGANAIPQGPRKAAGPKQASPKKAKVVNSAAEPKAKMEDALTELAEKVETIRFALSAAALASFNTDEMAPSQFVSVEN